MLIQSKHTIYAKIVMIVMCVMLVLPAAGCAKQQAPSEQAVNQEQAVTETNQEQPAEAEQPQQDAEQPQQQSAQLQPEPLHIQVLKVGKADAITLRCGEETMVIDCGESEDGEEVLAHLEAEGVQKIDVLMITHFDKDHVGGADTVLRGIPVGRVMIPAYEGGGKQYKEFMAALQETGIEPENVTKTLNFTLGSASATVEPPASYEIPGGAGDAGSDGAAGEDPAGSVSSEDEEYDNDFSLITTLELGDERLVFAGDIEEKRIREWLAEGTVQPCDFLKVPHHGVYDEGLSDLFEALQPAYAVICDSKKNPADERTLGLLDQCGTKYYQTMNGDINILCDGIKIEVGQ